MDHEHSAWERIQLMGELLGEWIGWLVAVVLSVIIVWFYLQVFVLRSFNEWRRQKRKAKYAREKQQSGQPPTTEGD